MRATLNMEGAVIGGRYLLKDLIGEGGMGGVFRAVDQTLQRNVAVKLLFSGDERDREQRVSRFLREARIAAAVHHKNIVNIIDFGSTDGGRPFMVMEYLEGETLAERLARSPTPTVGEVMRIMADTLGGLARAHEAGVVHRDMKPENIFLVDDADGSYPKILDFGISRSVLPESGPSSALTTREGFLVGTPQYMSPEQARGLKDVDRATDIYSVGVILYEAITGRLPFNSEHVGDLIILIASGNARTASEVREELGEPVSEVARKAMRVERTDRYEDARAMRKALKEALERMEDEEKDLSCPSRARRSLPPGPTAATKAGGVAADSAKIEQKDRASAAHAKTLPATPSNPDAIAPPSRAKASDSIETPNAWTVDQPAKPGSGRMVAAAVIVLVAGAGAWAWANQTPDPGPAEPQTNITEPDDSMDAATDDDFDAAPETERVTLEFEGAPEGAAITIDGVVVDGLLHTLDADDHQHIVGVVAEGFEPFETMCSADGDATIEIAMVPAVAVPSSSPMMRRGMRSGMMTPMGRMNPPTVIDDLDY